MRHGLTARVVSDPHEYETKGNDMMYPTQAPPTKFVGLAWSALILGIVGMVGSPIIVFNNLTAIAAMVGIVLGAIGTFGTRPALAAFGAVLCLGAVILTGVVQNSFADDLEREIDQIEREIDQDIEDYEHQIERDLEGKQWYQPNDG